MFFTILNCYHRRLDRRFIFHQEGAIELFSILNGAGGLLLMKTTQMPGMRNGEQGALANYNAIYALCKTDLSSGYCNGYNADTNISTRIMPTGQIRSAAGTGFNASRRNRSDYGVIARYLSWQRSMNSAGILNVRSPPRYYNFTGWSTLQQQTADCHAEVQQNNGSCELVREKLELKTQLMTDHQPPVPHHRLRPARYFYYSAAPC
jgi:hypothetical protein